jgi:hypothetical protein
MRRKSRCKSGLVIQFSLSLVLHSLDQMQTGNLTCFVSFFKLGLAFDLRLSELGKYVVHELLPGVFEPPGSGILLV